MFIDDKTVNMCKVINLDTTQQIQEFYTEICNMYEERWRSGVNEKMSNKEFVNETRKVFALWDSAVIMLKKSDDIKLSAMGTLLGNHTYKDHFLKGRGDLWAKLTSK